MSDAGNRPQDTVALQSIMDDCRAATLERVRKANSTTERAVLAVGAELERIVQEAQASADESRDVLSRLRQANSASVIDRQHEVVARYAREVSNGIAAQVATAERAVQDLDKILRLVRTIDQVAMESRTLALNATIVAGRAGAAGGAFAVIAGEMRRLSETVNKTAQTVGEIAENLRGTLPQVAAQAAGMQSLSSAFSQDLARQTREVGDISREVETILTTSLSNNDGRLGRIESGSHRALSELQFQDVVAQELLHCDTIIKTAAQRGQQLLDGSSPGESDSAPTAQEAEAIADAGEITLF